MKTNNKIRILLNSKQIYSSYVSCLRINVCMQLNPFVFRYSIETLLVRITMRRGERKLAEHYRHMPTHKHTYPKALDVLFQPTLMIIFLNYLNIDLCQVNQARIINDVRPK